MEHEIFKKKNSMDVFGALLGNILMSHGIIHHNLKRENLISIITFIFYDTEIEKLEEKFLKERTATKEGNQKRETSNLSIKEKKTKGFDRQYKDRVFNWYKRNSIPIQEIRRAVELNADRNTDDLILDIMYFAEESEEYYSNEQTCYEIKEELENQIDDYIGAGKILEVSDATILQKIFLFFVHYEYGKVKKKVPHEVNFLYLKRDRMPTIKADWNFIWVLGPAYAGKTRLLAQYAEDNSKSVVYCKNPESYKQIINQIVFEEDEILDEEMCTKLGCKRKSGLKTEERIKHILEEFILIVDGDELGKIDVEKLVKLSELDKIQIFVEVRSRALINYSDRHVIQVSPFTGDEAVQLFYLVSQKYGEEKKEDKNSELYKILPLVCRVACNNPSLIILLAEHYWWSINPRNKKSDENSAIKFLNDVVNFQPIGEMDKTIYGEEYYSALDYGKHNVNKQVQANILGHIRNLFKVYIPEVEQSVFYVLALLNGIKLSINYLTNWFDISENAIQELERNGWCTVDPENMIIGIPNLIVRAFGEDEFKNITELSVFKNYISNLSKTLNKREIQPTDVGIMQQVILRIHDVFFVQLKKKISMLDESIYEFHFSCIKYYLYYGNAVQAEKLGTLKSLEIDEKYKSHVYENILWKIKDYIGRNDLTTLFDDIIELLKTKSVFSSYFGTLAFLDMIYLWSENMIIHYIRLIMEGNCLKSNKIEIISLMKIYMVIISVNGKNSELCVRIKFYSEVFEDLLNYEHWSVKILSKRVQHWKSIEDGVDELESTTVNSIEKKIYMKSIILVLYELFYLSMFSLIGNKKNDDYTFSEQIFDYAEDMHENLRSRIQDISKQLLALKDRIQELPCNCAGVCILSCGLAGAILHDKSLMKRSESDSDYKYVTMYDQQQLSRIRKVIENNRKLADTEE